MPSESKGVEPWMFNKYSTELLQHIHFSRVNILPFYASNMFYYRNNVKESYHVLRFITISSMYIKKTGTVLKFLNKRTLKSIISGICHIHYIHKYSLLHPEYRNYFYIHLLRFSPCSQMSIFEDYMGHIFVQSFWNLQKDRECIFKSNKHKMLMKLASVIWF